MHERYSWQKQGWLIKVLDRKESRQWLGEHVMWQTSPIAENLWMSTQQMIILRQDLLNVPQAWLCAICFVLLFLVLFHVLYLYSHFNFLLSSYKSYFFTTLSTTAQVFSNPPVIWNGSWSMLAVPVQFFIKNTYCMFSWLNAMDMGFFSWVWWFVNLTPVIIVTLLYISL